MQISYFLSVKNYCQKYPKRPPFLPQAKMVNEAARLLFTRRQPLFTQNQRFSSHLHQFQEALLVKSFHYAVASLHLLSRSFHSLVKLPPVGERMCYLYSAALPLNFSTSKPIAAEPLLNGIFDKESYIFEFLFLHFTISHDKLYSRGMHFAFQHKQQRYKNNKKITE